jgi:hypothetical protein
VSTGGLGILFLGVPLKKTVSVLSTWYDTVFSTGIKVVSPGPGDSLPDIP